MLGCSNIYQSMANKTTDEALYEDAQILMDKQNWDDAIAKMNDLSADYKSRPDVIETWAGIYAGKCGLDFISYFTTLGSANLSSTTIFQYFMSAWTGKTVNPTYCTLAQTKIEEISVNPTLRTSGENLFMAILGMVKIGVYLRNYVDRDGNGTAEKNVCTNDSSNLPDAAVQEIVSGLGLIMTNLSYVTGVAASLTNSLSSVNTICNGLSGACIKTNPATVNSTDIDNFRDLLNTSSSNPTAPLGVGGCSNAAVSPCC